MMYSHPRSILHYLLAPLLLLTASIQSPAQPSYLPPGDPAAAGVRHLCLIYHGAKHRVAWTPDLLLPYVAAVDAKGRPTGWLFDSFLLIEFTNDHDAWFHHHREDKPQATAADWAWLADAGFRKGTGLDALDAAVAKAGRALADSRRTVNIFIAMPVPLRPIRDFGPLEGRDGKLDFSNEDHRRDALRWFIDRVAKRWKEAGYKRLKLAGFYWTDETLQAPDDALVRATADHLHQGGWKLFWVPYFGGRGIAFWRDAGIDAAMIQPNHFFTEKADLRRLAAAARIARVSRSGIEMEFDARALDSEDHRGRFWDYLDAGATYGWMKEAMIGYYDGGDGVKRMAEAKDGPGREMYDALCRFVQGTYKPSRGIALPDDSPIVRDNRDNLALASKGAKVIGGARPPGVPELAPEVLIDGIIEFYGGYDGYAYFAFPGAIGIELPRESTVARTQVLLWDLDERVFRYKIDTSVDGKKWDPAVDKSQGEWRGWQADRFEPRRARYIRFTGLHNSVNQNIQLVELEVYEKAE